MDDTSANFKGNRTTPPPVLYYYNFIHVYHYDGLAMMIAIHFTNAICRMPYCLVYHTCIFPMYLHIPLIKPLLRSRLKTRPIVIVIMIIIIHDHDYNHNGPLPQTVGPYSCMKSHSEIQ